MSQFKVKISVNISPPFSLNAEGLESCILKTFSGIDPQPYDYEIGEGKKEKPVHFFFIFEAENRFKVLEQATALRNELQKNWKQNTDQKVSWKIGEISEIKLSLIDRLKKYSLADDLKKCNETLRKKLL